jgi:hypothetical protein
VPLVVPGPKNSKRLDHFQSADLRVTRKFELERSSIDVFFELTNMFGRENPCCAEYELLPDDEGGGLETKTLRYLPRIPSVGFVWKF